MNASTSLCLLDALRCLVNAQAEDEALWCVADSIVEAYLQQELRRLHAAVEALLTNFSAQLVIPRDMTAEEAERLCAFVQSLVQPSVKEATP